MPKIYYYILRTDDGYAPCTDRGIFTLAICKPQIRRTAKKGDWILGITPVGKGHKLAYAANINKDPIDGKKYYSGRRTRKDKIYKFNVATNSFDLRHGIKMHVGRLQQKRDVDGTNAIVLKSTKFWYWGNKAQALDSFGTSVTELQKALARLTQGHRVNHSEEVAAELKKIIEKIKAMPCVLDKPADGLLLNEHDCTPDVHGIC